ncbi:MAG: hypothetical protein JW895_16570 [Thermoleophilaceae bacterium]|nr:hypothetical protein [Thermoleophilaceae bacterium]
MRRSLLLLALGASALSGCSLSSSSSEPGDDDGDKRAAALTCLTEEKHLDAADRGDNQIVVGDPESGPRIVFYLTSGQAEAAQFEGDGEGAEQIGAALLFVREADDDTLESVEDCLTSL